MKQTTAHTQQLAENIMKRAAQERNSGISERPHTNERELSRRNIATAALIQAAKELTLAASTLSGSGRAHEDIKSAPAEVAIKLVTAIVEGDEATQKKITDFIKSL